MLDHLVEDKNLAWDSETIKEFDIVLTLSDGAKNELHSVYKSSEAYNQEISAYDFKLDELRKELEEIRANYLEEGPGFFILDDFWSEEYSIDQGKNGLLVASQLFGTPLQQNATGLLVKELKDRDVSYDGDGKSRYSDNRHGGNYHTDGAEIPPPIPEYLPLLSIRQSKEGGSFIVVSSYAVHNKLLETNPGTLAKLYGNFLWDRRGDLGPNGEATFEKPIFSFNGGKLECAYLRRYIEDGYLTEGIEMGVEEKGTLDALDEVVYDPSLEFRVKMDPGQLLVSINSRTLHGREPFEDYRRPDGSIDPERQRLKLRTWVVK